MIGCDVEALALKLDRCEADLVSIQHRVAAVRLALCKATPRQAVVGHDYEAQAAADNERQLRLLASAVKKLLPAPLLAEVLAYLDPLGTFKKALEEYEARLDSGGGTP